MGARCRNYKRMCIGSTRRRRNGASRRRRVSLCRCRYNEDNLHERPERCNDRKKMASDEQVIRGTSAASLKHGQSRPRRLLRVVVGIFAMIGLLSVLVIASPLVQWLIPAKAGSFDPPAGDTLVVLAAGSIGDAPNLESSWRCIYAARFYRMGLYRRVVLSG